MKAPRNFALVAVAVFAVSYFLPAYGSGSGFACFGVCWEMLLGHDTKVLSGAWFYYSGFVIANLFFIGLVVALFATTNPRRLRLAFSIVFFLHVLSWLVLNIFQHPSQLVEIKLGYYVWLCAYGLLVVAHLWKDSNGRLEPIPFERSIV